MDYNSCHDCNCRGTSNRERKTSLSVYILVCLFGIGSWLAVNGIWMELPVLVDHAPEKWSLPSYLTVITELANVGPLIYFIGSRIYPKYVHERTAIYTITVLGTFACILLAFFWSKTSYVFGAERSSALIVLSFFVALVDCTSTVTFLPFMAILPEMYMSALFTGENMSSLLPSFFSLIQGVDKRKVVSNTICNNGTCHNATMTVFTGLSFGPKYFFLFLAFMLVTCGAAFVALNYLPLATKHHVMKYSDFQRTPKRESPSRIQRYGNDEEADRASLLDSNSLLAKEQEDLQSDLSLATFPGSSNEIQLASKISLQLIYLLILQAWINCISNGVLSQIQAFACEPYGATAYHLAVTLSGIASALTCIAYIWLPTKSVKIISVCGFIFTAASTYIIMLAGQSPYPILKGTDTGNALVVIAFILSGIFVNYAKLAICTIFRKQGHRELFWCGVAIQVGSFVGAIVMFPLVNVAKLFKQ